MKLSDNFFDALRQLEERHTRTKPSKNKPSELLSSTIRTAPQVFQPRQLFGDEVAKYHVNELKRAASGKGAKLEELLVMQIGNNTYCIDGHHRLAAYKELNISTPVPVKWFEGTVRKAVVRAAECNSRDKLPMSKGSKLEAAWRMVVLGLGSIAEVSKATTISEATVSTMRSKLKALKEAHENGPSDDEFDSDSGPGEFVCQLTWDEVKRGEIGHPEKDDKWREKIINDWARRLSLNFGKKWGQHPDLAARAIERFSERLPLKLAEAWQEDGLLDELGPQGEE